MSQAEPETPGHSRGPVFYVLIGGGVVVAALFSWLILGPAPGRPTNPGVEKKAKESNLELARQGLARETDLNTCRTSLQQINTHLGQQTDLHSPTLSPEEKERLQRKLGLDPGALAEIGSGSFTLLDAHHLDLCFLLRDAARSLQISGEQAKGPEARAAERGPRLQQTPVERATTAFAWVMRLVRPDDSPAPVLPPGYALRRGWGSPLDRALVFLELLRQVAPAKELQGCLVYCPAKAGGPAGNHLWACGVVVEGGPDLFLFDPRLGLPLPGPDGKGVATLAQARKDPAVLGQLTIDSGHPYDVTAGQAAAAELRLVCPLSALAPRMRFLEEKLLPPVVKVSLSVDVNEDQKRLERAAQGQGAGPLVVRPWTEPAGQGPELDGPGLLRRFLPAEEGGADLGKEAPKMVPFLRSLVPWSYLPEKFQNERQFPRNVGLGRRVLEVFANPFIGPVFDPQHPRNLILRGRFSKAAPELTEKRRPLKDQISRRDAVVDLDKQIDTWVNNKAIPLYADLQRASNPQDRAAAEQQINELWAKESQPVFIMLQAAMARPRDREIVYLMGQCKHGLAEQIQAQLDLARKTRTEPAELAQRARDAWTDAQFWWQHYLEEYSGEPGKEYPGGTGTGTVRQLRGRAEAMLGHWQEAATSWADLTEPLTPMEKVAGLYLAQRIRKDHEK